MKKQINKANHTEIQLKTLNTLLEGRVGIEEKYKLANLGSAQKEVLSNSGTISVTFKYLAIATMSHICIINMYLACKKFRHK